MEPINPKVTYSTLGGMGGGTMVAIVIIWILKKQYGYVDADFSPEFVAALGGILSGPCAFISGWLKKYAPPQE